MLRSCSNLVRITTSRWIFVYAKPPRKTLDRCFFLSWGGTEPVSPAGISERRCIISVFVRYTLLAAHSVVECILQRHAKTFQGSSYRTALQNLGSAHSAGHKELLGSPHSSERGSYSCLSGVLTKEVVVFTTVQFIHRDLGDRHTWIDALGAK